MYNTVVMFYSFPKKLSERMIWLKSLNMLPSDYAPTRRICSRHFKEEDLLPLASNYRRYVLAGAIPSLIRNKHKRIKVN